MMLRRRPRRLIVLMGLLALFQLASAWRALVSPADLTPLVHLPPALDVVAGGLWTLVFAWMTFDLLRLNESAQTMAGWALAGFVAYSAVRLLVFAQADYDRERLSFLLLLISLTLVFLMARWLRRFNERRILIDDYD